MKLFAFCLILLCGSMSVHSNPTNAIPLGVEFVLTNAHLTIQLPQSAQIRQGRVTSIGIYDMAPHGSKFVSGAVYNDYKIFFEITIKTEHEFKHDAEFFQTDDFQEHLSLKMYDIPIGKRLRKDIRDTERNKILSISVNVLKTDSQGRETGTFQEDIQMAKEMIESIKLTKMQSDEK